MSNFNYDVTSGNQFIKPESGNVFVTMDVKFRNNSKTSQKASSLDFKLKSAGIERNLEFIGPCETWSSVDVAAGASYGPKCLSFQAVAGKPTGIVLTWKPGLVKTYDIPLEGAATSGGAKAAPETSTTTTTTITGGTAASVLDYCSPGVSATQGVSCELASNVFYEYYKAVQSGKSTLSAWSPQTKKYYTASCSKVGGTVTCHISGSTVPNAQVQITQADLDVYTAAQASEYARTHDVGPHG